MKKAFPYLALSFLLLAACSKSPFDRSSNASGGALGGFGSGNFVVFSDELKTGGGAFLFPGGENQTLSFADTSNPVSRRSIRYFWTGDDVSSQFGPEHTFAGFDLMHTINQSDYATTPGRDLSKAGYKKVTFYARGSLSSQTLVKVQSPDDGNNATVAPCISLSTDGTLDDTGTGGTPCLNLGTLSTSWQQYTLTITSPSQLTAVKDLFKATFIFVPIGGSTAPGQGGTVYFDQIQLQP